MYLTIECDDTDSADILTAFLSDYPFECFNDEATECGVRLETSMLAEEWKRCSSEVMALVEEYGRDVTLRLMEDENWNERWERESFEPVEIDDLMLIRSAYHNPPTNQRVIDIVISPAMSFGTGHHFTTRMMCRLIHEYRPSGRVLDVGCGTGVLSIAALKCGAEHADAVDIDPWSVESARRGAELNGLSHRMTIFTGTVDTVEGRRYDALYANINRNIILSDIDRYVEALNDGGWLFVSGFLEGDVEAVRSVAQSRGLRLEKTLSENEWVAMVFVKQ